VKRILKTTSKIFVITILVIVFLVIAAFVSGKIYKDEITNYVISEINREINVKVSVSSADFSVFRKFPFISVVLSDATALSGKEFQKSEFAHVKTDTLFTATRIYLQFNILDILRKDYRLRRVHAENGKLNVFVDSHGGGNYKIFKENKTGQKNNFTLGLDGVKLSGFSWKFINLSKEIHSEGFIEETVLKGNFSQNSFSLNTVTSIFIKTFNREGIEYASDLKITARVILDVKDSAYMIKRGELTLNDLVVKIGGSFNLAKKINLDLQIAGENLNIKSLITTLPIKMESVSAYSPGGKADILAKIKGEISSTAVPSIRAAFKVANGIIYLPSQKSHLSGIALRGTYSNGSNRNAVTSRLNLSEYSINYESSLIKGKLSISNFLNPFLSASIAGTISAIDVSKVLNMDGLSLEKGIFYPDLSVNFNVDSFSNLSIDAISENGLNGNLAFKEIAGTTPFTNIPISLLEGNIKMEGSIWVPNFKMKLGKTSLSASLMVNNLWEFFMRKTRIPEIKGEIISEYFNVYDFIDDSESTEEYDFYLPDSIFLDFHCKADSFVYGKFLSSNLETWFTYSPGKLSVSSIKIRAMKGSAIASGVITGNSEGPMLLRTSGELRKIDINKLFYAFNNFGQDFIISENLKGSASGTIDFSAFISPEFDLLTKDLTAQSDFIIEDGELINFEPITELSDFVELSELQHIRFSTLRNSILIKDEKVYIPQMDINSTAFNISISGTHGFDSHFEYRLRLSLSELLARKAKKAKKENEEFGVVEADASGNTNLYLSVIGTPDDYKIKYDKKEAINKIKSDLKEEKKLLKSILKEDLGLFKKDSASSGNIIHSSNPNQFKMDWGDEETVPDKTPVKDKKNKKKEPALEITWDENETEIK
jgi:hypothetical protein